MEGRQRYLCSHLVSLVIEEQTALVNLEEIWTDGALLECEAAATEGAYAEIRCDAVLFAGRVKSVEQHDFGWRVVVQFSPLTTWSLASFRPEHLLPI